MTNTGYLPFTLPLLFYSFQGLECLKMLEKINLYPLRFVLECVTCVHV